MVRSTPESPGLSLALERLAAGSNAVSRSRLSALAPRPERALLVRVDDWESVFRNVVRLPCLRPSSVDVQRLELALAQRRDAGERAQRSARDR